MKFAKDIILKDNDICYYFKYLEWDSNFFNKSSYMLDISKSKLLYSEKIIKLIKQNFKDSFITVKIDTNTNFKIINLLQNTNFYYVDTEIILTNCTQNLKTETITNNINVEEINSNDMALPYSKLGNTFSLTRFHTDPNIDDKQADELWVNYLKNYKTSKNKYIFIARYDIEVAGIFLVNLNKDIANIFFVSVLPEYQGLGIGKKLIKKVTKRFDNFTITIGTQVKNINALNFYINNGFNNIKNTSVVFHRWV